MAIRGVEPGLDEKGLIIGQSRVDRDFATKWIEQAYLRDGRRRTGGGAIDRKRAAATARRYEDDTCSEAPPLHQGNLRARRLKKSNAAPR